MIKLDDKGAVKNNWTQEQLKASTQVTVDMSRLKDAVARLAEENEK